MRSALSVLLVSALGLGCSENAVVGGRVDALADVTVTDATSPDKPGPTDVPIDKAAPAPDVLADVADATDGPVLCTSDAMCAGDPGGAVCDTTTGRCVECVASRDTCPADRHCDDASHRCLAGCRSDEGCATTTADAGAPARLRCDTATRACVECVTNAHCAAGTLCVGNVCIAGCDPSQGCPAGQTCCSGGCVDVQANTSHCGACGTRCEVPNSAPACRNSQCAVGGCTAPFADCDMSATNGCETDTNTAVAHCGRCGNACPAPAHASATCAAGACGLRCDEGFADCDGNAANGCETDLASDPAACGACGVRCDPANATPACRERRCAVGMCMGAFLDCDGNATNGCEVDGSSSVAHCGRCGSACPSPPGSVPACVAGRCGFTCMAGLADCDGDASNGCETDTRTSAAHCGSCGRACAGANVATPACRASTCAVGTCATGFGDCDSDAANGCETDTRTSVAHCGRCANACATAANASAACAMGTCGLVCAMGFADCDMSAANGCEADTRTSNAHCGRCANACARGSSCVASTCRIDPGCADGTREGFTDTARFPAIAACQGTFMGYIDEASARSICAPGWHVCRGGDAVVRSVRSADARAFTGCFAYDAAQDCNYCSATCRGIVGDPSATCSVADGDRDADMAGVGSGCSDYGAATATCLADGRIDAATNTFGCRYDPRLAGVVCCLD